MTIRQGKAPRSRCRSSTCCMKFVSGRRTKTSKQ